MWNSEEHGVKKHNKIAIALLQFWAYVVCKRFSVPPTSMSWSRYRRFTVKHLAETKLSQVHKLDLAVTQNTFGIFGSKECNWQ